jgi:MOSC domain-containing protein YiiM
VLSTALERAFGHINMGVYAEVIAGGEIAVGDALKRVPNGRSNSRRPSSLSDWSLADRGMERRFALREPATGR